LRLEGQEARFSGHQGAQPAGQAQPKAHSEATPSRSQPRPTKPHEWWGIDMTKVLVEGFGWVYFVLVLDWYTNKIVG
jgi:putative transposase